MKHKIVESGDSTVITGASEAERSARQDFYKLFKKSPIPEGETLDNLALFMKRQNLSRVLMLNEIYKKIIHVHGIICEFGVHWGSNLALYESFRGMYEPYNYNRKIVGFDTWEGFPSIHEKDGTAGIAQKGAYATTKGYEAYLEEVMNFHESNAPLAHKKKFELVKGDASRTIHEYLAAHPETIIAFAYFDFDIYEPTKVCLEAILPHLSKGAIIGFDELNFPDFPGETLAFKEVLGAGNYRIHRDPNNPSPSYIIFE